MKIKICILFYLFSCLTFVDAQEMNLIQDNYFEHVAIIDFEEIDVVDYQNHWVKTKREVSSVSSFTRQSDGMNVLQLNLRVNSVKVDDNFVSTRISSGMKAGEEYKISLEVAKDKFSGYSVKELTVMFTASVPSISKLTYNDWRNSALIFSLDSVNSSSSTVKLEAVYTAMGGENYIHLGSINQTFKFFETTKYNLMLADETYKAGIAGAVYYITNINIKPLGNQGKTLLAVNRTNVQDVKNDFNNLVFNGGFEHKITERIQTTTFNSSGDLVGPFIRSVNEMGVKVIQSDSNDYRSVYQKEALPYMGNSLASFKAISTNEHHIYQKSIRVDKGQDYNTTYFFENAPPKDTMPVYKYGANICFTLKEALIKDSTYSFSLMLQLDKKSAYGLDFLGVHMLDSFPENTQNKLWDKLPNQVIPIKDLTKVGGWAEKQILFNANGGEKFIAIGAVYPRSEIFKNQNFIPEVSSTCGPNDAYCIGRQVYFADSLFANYFVDNVVCLPISHYLEYPSAIYNNDINQVEFVFTPLLRGSDEKESLFNEVQSALITCLDVLRISDAICVADITKRDEVTLDPYEVINKKKIIRKISRPKLQRKIKDLAEDDSMLLFSGEEIKGFNNHLIIIVDESFDFSNWEYKLTMFDKNGGYLTFISLVDSGSEDIFTTRIGRYRNALVINAKKDNVREKLLKRLTLKM